MAQASGGKALNVLASPLLFANLQIIMKRVEALHLPAIYQFPEVVDLGGFAAYGPRLANILSEQIARQIVELFRGKKLAEVPVEQPTKFELAINLKTAKALGVTVPQSLLLRADVVIE